MPTNPSPPIAPTADFKELLDAFRMRAIEWETLDPECDPSYEEYARDRFVASRKEVEDYVAVLKAEREIESRRVEDWINREAKLCPEDFGIEEYIHSLQKQLTSVRAEDARLLTG